MMDSTDASPHIQPDEVQPVMLMGSYRLGVPG